MNKLNLISLAAVIAIIFVTSGCVVNNDGSDNTKQLKRAQVALKKKLRNELRRIKSEDSYQIAMNAYEKTLTEGDHVRGFKYLFIDLKHVQSMNGTEQVFHQPVKERGPVIEPNRPWEGDRVDIWSSPVWSEEQRLWQMWYWGGDGLFTMYAESSDGLRWNKPNLGLFEWKGSMENNIINLGFKSGGKENRIVLIRDDRETDPERRFKGITRVKGNLIALVSGDGLNWKHLEGEKIVSGDEYRLGYDAIKHRFIVTAKSLRVTDEHYRHSDGNRPLSEFGRRVDVSVSKDFINWSRQKLIFWGDEEDQKLGINRIMEVIEDNDRRRPLFINHDEFYTDVYNMVIFTYGEMYLGLPMIFNQSGRYTPRWGGNSDGILYPSLVATRDSSLHQWNRLSRQPFIPLSRLSDKHNYDYGMISSMPPVLNNNELWFYYNGSRYTHLTQEIKDALIKSSDEPKHSIFLARMRIDGFASLHAGLESGEIITVPVKITGPRLFVNADAGEGSVKVEIIDASTGKPISGYTLTDDLKRNVCIPVSKDATSIPLQWLEKKDLSELLGHQVLLHFSISNSHLYSFWFDD